MVRHVRVRLVNGLCHGLPDGNGLIGLGRFCKCSLTVNRQAGDGEQNHGAGELKFPSGNQNYEARALIFISPPLQSRS